jgi:hypothetical protein
MGNGNICVFRSEGCAVIISVALAVAGSDHHSVSE